MDTYSLIPAPDDFHVQVPVIPMSRYGTWAISSVPNTSAAPSTQSGTTSSPLRPGTWPRPYIWRCSTKTWPPVMTLWAALPSTWPAILTESELSRGDRTVTWLWLLCLIAKKDWSSSWRILLALMSWATWWWACSWSPSLVSRLMLLLASVTPSLDSW